MICQQKNQFLCPIFVHSTYLGKSAKGVKVETEAEETSFISAPGRTQQTFMFLEESSVVNKGEDDEMVGLI